MVMLLLCWRMSIITLWGDFYIVVKTWLKNGISLLNMEKGLLLAPIISSKEPLLTIKSNVEGCDCIWDMGGNIVKFLLILVVWWEALFCSCDCYCFHMFDWVVIWGVFPLRCMQNDAYKCMIFWMRAILTKHTQNLLLPPEDIKSPIRTPTNVFGIV